MKPRMNPNAGNLLLNQYLTPFDFHEIHHLFIPAPAREIYPQIQRMDLNDSRVVRSLFRLRGIPADDIRLENMVTQGPFRILDQRADEELFIGLLCDARIRPIEFEGLETFKAFAPQQGLKIGWNFSLIPRGTEGCILKTETRVRCFGALARLGFGFYWMGIRFFSGWIRMEMLKSVRHQTLNTIKQQQDKPKENI